MERMSLSQLSSAGYGLPEAFLLPLGVGHNACEFSCREVLRWLPGRRLVARTCWSDAAGGSREAVLKLFLGQDAARYRRRELEGLSLLAKAGVKTPALLAEVVDRDAQASGLVFSFVSEARVVAAEDPAAFDAIAKAFARLHQSGIRQHDLNLKNFLFADDALWMVDGDAVSTTQRALSVAASIGNLGELLAERPPGGSDDLTGPLRAYCQVRGWTCTAELEARLEKALRRARRDRIGRYRKKCQRSCSEFAVEKRRQWSSVRLRDLEPRIWEVFAADSERVIANGEVIKAGNSATVARWQTRHGESLIVKRYNVKSTWHGLRRMLTPRPRYRLAWQNGQVLELLHIPTARPLALVEQVRAPARTVAYLLLEDLGDHTLRDEIEAQGLSVQRARETAALFARLRAAGLRHGDTKASNFLIHDDRVCCVDLDAMSADDRGWRRDVQRFLKNWQGDVRRGFEMAFADLDLLP